VSQDAERKIVAARATIIRFGKALSRVYFRHLNKTDKHGKTTCIMAAGESQLARNLCLHTYLTVRLPNPRYEDGSDEIQHPKASQAIGNMPILSSDLPQDLLTVLRTSRIGDRVQKVWKRDSLEKEGLSDMIARVVEMVENTDTKKLWTMYEQCLQHGGHGEVLNGRFKAIA
jgi:hypothetical protein